jgi:cytochrome b involved in lipid metabolism
MKIKTLITLAIINMLLVYSLLFYLTVVNQQFTSSKFNSSPKTNTTPSLKSVILPTITSKTNQLNSSENVNKCIIIVKGLKFDITDFRKVHSGGDIFECGTDMTNAFDSQHGNREFQILKKYQI